MTSAATFPDEAPPTGRTEALSFRVEPELRAAILAAAARDGRPVSNFVRKVLIDRLEEATGG